MISMFLAELLKQLSTCTDTSSSDLYDPPQTGHSKMFIEHPLPTLSPDDRKGSKGSNSPGLRSDVGKFRGGGGGDLGLGVDRVVGDTRCFESTVWDGRAGGSGLGGAEEEEPSTLPWPLNLPDEDDENGLFTFFMKPLTLSLTSSMEINRLRRIRKMIFFKLN
eukprot:TRINITY_DN21206_c0_g1_i1.p1 TRINITY_DN21206_c0_g1~~TRINITY_DN21206_c0_g1_i1.p1  ORF type:complete len:163 (-),score=19.02 TRINITY_DN21206_c0_g1_i1:7-495(-)